jgi:hypothetical protein
MIGTDPDVLAAGSAGIRITPRHVETLLVEVSPLTDLTTRFGCKRSYSSLAIATGSARTPSSASVVCRSPSYRAAPVAMRARRGPNLVLVNNVERSRSL